MAQTVPDKTYLEPGKWSTIPGTVATRLYPIIRKPSVTCSNTFIVKSSRYIFVIDPGTDMEQIKEIKKTVLVARREEEKPVYILLTHCHIDHFLALDHLTGGETGGQTICHSVAARAITTRDENITLANMNGSTLPHCPVLACLFERPEDRDFYVKNPLHVLDAGIALKDGRVVPSIFIALDDVDKMEVIHTPGHSPDSLCYKIGRYLFSGDLHLATTPGIAGKSGWDNEGLAVSLKVIMEKGEKDGIELLLPGHGNPLPFDKARKILTSALQTAEKLSGLTRFDRERSLYVSEYALVLLEEAGIMFSIIAGRLLKTSYYLDMLGEISYAEDILHAIDSDALDATIEEFHSYMKELKVERGAPVISKAVQFAQKVNDIFKPDSISWLFEPCFINRIKSLLSDFVNVVYGIQYRDQETIFDLNESVSHLLLSLNEDALCPGRITDAWEDEKEFALELARRIAYTPLFSETRFTFTPSAEKLLVRADKLMFQDVLMALFEQLAISRSTEIFVAVRREGDSPILHITPSDKGFILRESKLLYLKHSMKLAGGEFTKIDGTEGESAQSYRYSFSPLPAEPPSLMRTYPTIPRSKPKQ